MKRWFETGMAAIIVMVLLTAVLPITTVQAQNANDQVWKFVVFGDTVDPDTSTSTGINPFLSDLSTKIASDGPDLVINVGDLVSGMVTYPNSTVHTDFDAQFINWKNAVKPIYDFNASSGIPIYITRGNHEVEFGAVNATLIDSYVRNIGSLMPQNGPSGEIGFTYSIQHKGAEFISVDQYLGQNISAMGTVNQPWLDQRLAADTSEFTFVWGHTPAYSNIDEAPSMNMNPVERDAFWSSLNGNNVTAYFCGHVHNYARGNGNGTWEVVVGEGGATPLIINSSFFGTNMNDTYPSQSMGNVTADIGYLLVTVDETAGTAHAQLKMHGEANNTWYEGDSFTMLASNFHATKAENDQSLPIVLTSLLLLSVVIAAALIYRRRIGN
jgi:hypothetical protein